MDEPRYSFRPAVNGAERLYTLSGADLLWTEGEETHRLSLASVRSVRVYDSPGLKRFGAPVSAPLRRCVLRAAPSVTHVLSSSHYIRFGVTEDRSEAFLPFLHDLVQRIRAANPAARIKGGMPAGLWLLWALVLALEVLVAAFGIYGAETSVFGEKRDLFNALLFFGLGLGCASAAVGVSRVLRHGRPRAFRS